MPERPVPHGWGFGENLAGRVSETLAGLIRPGRRRLWSKFGPSEAEVRANLAGQASADAALALQEARTEAEPVGISTTPVPQDLTAAAFFDVDNTMVQGASIIHFARGLAARDYFTKSDLAEFAWQQVKFRVTGKENSDDVASEIGRAHV